MPELSQRSCMSVICIISNANFSAFLQVTLFEAVRNPAKAENFSLFVDSFVQNLTIYVTGNSPTYTITSPSGV